MLLTILLIILVLICLVIAAKYLISLNKNVKEKIIKEETRFSIYQNKLETLKESKLDKKSLEELDKIVKMFFKEELKIKTNLTYLELSKEFERKKDYELMKFCNLISNLLYSGEKITTKDFEKALNLFLKILENKSEFLKNYCQKSIPKFTKSN